MAVVAALVLLVEAVGIVVLNGIMARLVQGQNMSLDGLDPKVMVGGTWGLGIGGGLFLLLCSVLLLLTGVRDRAPGRFARVVLISCAVLHGVLGALTVGLVGWPAFAFMMVVLALVVLPLVAYGKRPRPDARPAGPSEPDAPAAGAEPATA
ncbi:hypothetical protein [Streptomyces sp. t39]|uniref:hypothetical protein n=1 Tax=Streptomyces sp. t39 TaxID=1828156 RepID=UPI0021C96526|nr:hypothetical protein [Streptomyces sp. t39]